VHIAVAAVLKAREVAHANGLLARCLLKIVMPLTCTPYPLARKQPRLPSRSQSPARACPSRARASWRSGAACCAEPRSSRDHPRRPSSRRPSRIAVVVGVVLAPASVHGLVLGVDADDVVLEATTELCSRRLEHGAGG
jgi:hypothetical protein